MKNIIQFAVVIYGFMSSSACVYYEIPKPKDWSSTIKQVKEPTTETIRVDDTESDTVLFWYQSYPSAQPVKVEKVSETRWVVVFEKK
ncbi:MAG TPA: hypothetical protein VGB68_03040 [Pyrinomonadaceae bacterium]|jgi:hypothetical protein